VLPQKPKVAFYARCSTLQHEQNPQVQIDELRRYSKARGWVVVEEVVDHGYSGSSDKRPGLNKLKRLVQGRSVDIVLVTKMDRLFRSTKHIVCTLSEWDELGIQFVSLHDHIDATTSSGRLMMKRLSQFSVGFAGTAFLRSLLLGDFQFLLQV